MILQTIVLLETLETLCKVTCLMHLLNGKIVEMRIVGLFVDT